MGALGTLFGGADTSGISSQASSIGGGANKDSSMGDLKSGYDTFEKNKLPPGHDTYQPSDMSQQSIVSQQQSPQSSSYSDLMNYLKGVR